MTIDDVAALQSGDRVTHIETGAPAIVESIAKWGWPGSAQEDRVRVEVVLRFGGDPRTDPWGPFVEAPRYSDEAPRDLERITISEGTDEWERA